MQIRKPAVAGQFYPGIERDLCGMLKEMTVPVRRKKKVLGIVSPHAGYVYSGSVAGQVYSNIEIPGTAIILGPNHTGMGEPYGIMSQGKWKTPLGEVEIENALANAIMKVCPLIAEDNISHAYEHSLEVQVPFLQYFRPDIQIVPIVIGGREYNKIGEAIALAMNHYAKDCLIVASSDMTHYEPHESATKKDKLAIDKILKLNEKELLENIAKHKITMCGYGPVSIMLIAAKLLGAKEASLIDYKTSGDTSGDYGSVVGYAGIMVY